MTYFTSYQIEQWCQNFIWTGDILKKGIVTVSWDTICFTSYQVEQWCQNFIWTSDILKKGIVTVSWDTICSPLENGGLKIINL